MTLTSRLAKVRRALLREDIGRRVAAALALLGILLGAQRLGRAGLTTAVHALSWAAAFMFNAGWLVLLLAAAALALGRGLSSVHGRKRVRKLVSWEGCWLVRSLVAGGLLLVLVLIVVVLPPRLADGQGSLTASERLKAQNDVRTTLLQALAGIVLATGAYLTFRQLLVTREGQVTDRYTKAIGQLGDTQSPVRIGGVYALERIGNDSDRDRTTIIYVLGAFVRERSKLPRERQDDPPEDVKAALRVLGRLLPKSDPEVKLGLRDADLRNTDLSDIPKDRVKLDGAKLEGAKPPKESGGRAAIPREVALPRRGQAED